ncbi:unnamed protein product [Effrenium voratum]|uniref:Uncharacterized protein n=1 Tax=Effrenium voratum TaxID=2562239 RepID=A0AA36JI82_9DINO|nr:unnamed protein product [Effrenium voratum]CAJ1406092.1 unnamed protein product [Effrenium voratum]
MLSYECNASERQLREDRERELLRQGSLEPLERLDEALMEKLTDAGMLSWLESEENRELLFQYLTLIAKATAWYKEPAEVYFAAKRKIMLASLELPDAAEVVAKFLEEEMATIQEAVFAMPRKGHFLPKLFELTERLSQEGCVQLE